MKKAVFIDKDGTLIRDVPYSVQLSDITLTDGVAGFLRTMRRLHYTIVVVSNQAGLAHGYFDRHALTRSFDHINRLLADEGAQIDDFFYCPHHPAGRVLEYALPCDCRKPEPGLILQAAAKHGIELAESWMIGDILNDVEAGNRAGCKTILMDMGNESEWNIREMRCPLLIAGSFEEAAEFITLYDTIQV